MFALIAEVNVAMHGSSSDQILGGVPCDGASKAQKATCNAIDQSGTQQTYSLAASLDF